MRIKLKFISNESIRIATSYNNLLQGLIYNLLETFSASFLHNSGFNFENRYFKLFCFSEIFERGFYDKNKKTFIFSDSVSFVVSSPVEWILKEIALNGIRKEVFSLGNNQIRLDEISVIHSHNKTIKTNSLIVKALTPIEVHSTLSTLNGAKKTYYYNPREKEFPILTNENAKKKFSAFYKTPCPYELKCTPLSKDLKETIRYFNNTVIKGYKGSYRLEADPKMLEFIIDAGLGSRNSQGFGMVEIV